LAQIFGQKYVLNHGDIGQLHQLNNFSSFSFPWIRIPNQDPTLIWILKEKSAMTLYLTFLFCTNFSKINPTIAMDNKILADQHKIVQKLLYSIKKKLTFSGTL
jgi:hypothetical protein